jgi:hypothetical protein
MHAAPSRWALSWHHVPPERWFVDETKVKVRAEWVYRAVDRAGCHLPPNPRSGISNENMIQVL